MLFGLNFAAFRFLFANIVSFCATQLSSFWYIFLLWKLAIRIALVNYTVNNLLQEVDKTLINRELLGAVEKLNKDEDGKIIIRWVSKNTEIAYF